MRKERIYLDTSVISYLDQSDSPEKMEETHEFWNLLKLGLYEVIISEIAIMEILKCSENKQQILFEYINQISYVLSEENDESLELAERYISYAVLTEKSLIDCRHIALASIYECDYIMS